MLFLHSVFSLAQTHDTQTPLETKPTRLSTHALCRTSLEDSKRTQSHILTNFSKSLKVRLRVLPHSPKDRFQSRCHQTIRYTPDAAVLQNHVVVEILGATDLGEVGVAANGLELVTGGHLTAVSVEAICTNQDAEGEVTELGEGLVGFRETGCWGGGIYEQYVSVVD